MSAAEAVPMPPMPPAMPNQSIYLLPEELSAHEANQKARPGETPIERKARVELMAESIRANGQEYPVLVAEVEDRADDGSSFIAYQYVDGGCRVDAVALLNAAHAEPRSVWCSILPADSDYFRLAVVGNLHRTQNNMLQMAGIVRETQERNGWSGRGADTQAAEYLGLSKTAVSNYKKLLHAPDSVRARVQSGEFQSLDAVVKLMTQPADKREDVLKTAREVAEEERAQREALHKNLAVVDEHAAEAVKPAKVKARHVAEAARRVSPAAGNAVNSARSRQQLVDALRTIQKQGGFTGAAKKFLDYYTGSFAPGMDGDTDKAVKKMTVMYAEAVKTHFGGARVEAPKRKVAKKK